MANWSRKKVLKLAKGFTGRRKNVFGIALRAVHKAAQYMYRDRKQKKRIVRRDWISTINAATREHGLSYSRFAFALEKTSNIEIDRKILSTLAVTEPYSFKCVFDEVKLQAGFKEMSQRKPLVAQMCGLSYMEALDKGFIVDSKIQPFNSQETRKIIEADKINLYGLRNPGRDAGTDADYMRMSFVEEDEAFLKEQSRLQLTDAEQKSLPREILTDNWEEDMALYKHKRKQE